MQDKYAGDIGDFGKYGLLHELFKQAGGNICLGINWYYATREEILNSDGNHIAYLNTKNRGNVRFRSCFPNLYDNLRTIVRQNRRSIAEIGARGILPRETIFYSVAIPHSGDTAAERISLRQDWFEKSQSHLSQADIIFLDPDNGINLDPSKKADPNAVKYVFPDEIETYYGLGKSLIIYNHRDRRPREEYERKILINRKHVKSPSDVKHARCDHRSIL